MFTFDLYKPRRTFNRALFLAGAAMAGWGAPCAMAALTSGSARVEFSTYLGTEHREHPRDAAMDPQGNLYVVGDVDGASGQELEGQQQVFLTKYSPTGEVIYNVYFGGKSDEYAYGVAVDAAGQAVVTGLTFSSENEYEEGSEGFPVTENAFQKDYGRVFVSQVNAEGTDLTYSTYLYGDTGYAVTVDQAGMIYVTGEADRNFKGTPGAYQTENGGFLFGNGFVAKIDPTKSGAESLIYATLYGGEGSGAGYAIEVDAQGNAHVAGQAGPSFKTTANAAQTTFGGDMTDAYIVKVNPTGTDLHYATLLGGSDFDSANGLALDAQGNAYITGTTYLSFPTTEGAFQKDYNLGNCSGSSFELKACADAFVAKIDSTGSQVIYATYLGGQYNDYGTDIVVDADGVATVTGQTLALNFPVLDPLQKDTAGSYDAFLTRVKPDGSGLLFSTYLGGDAEDEPEAIVAASPNTVYITGETWSKDYPVLNPTQEQNAGETDGFVTKIVFENTPNVPVKGDATLDGNLNIADATLTLRFSVSLATPTAEQLAAADMNGDGKITVADATALLRKVVGLD